ncbi:CHAT domain-containing protein [Streptomyces sp. TRM66268-LWL]|uniref:CHAT domain-containing protein n=1 Tax=Streptomyces polyasparticus TaxID=2767826 RepID=A0ABR7S827_9ACTN|nr:CHAT domain-containing protein [Streptomyces polyasparticus]MBC9711573.1 CHAT domain-containing protein [Streptomyces polyasparticus]
MSMVDFQADVGPAGPDAYQVTLRTADGAEASTDHVGLPVGAQELRMLCARIPDAILASSAVVRRSAPPEERPVQELGRILFDILMAGEGRALFATARHRAAEADRSLRLVLRVRPPELARLPWEFLFDSAENSYVCTTVALVRRPELAVPQRPLTVAAPLRILCMAARPDGLDPLAVQSERERLGDALSDLRRAGLIELGWVEGETWRALRTALTRRGPWHALHFIGHGGFDPVAQEVTLALAGEDGGTYQLGAENLAMMLDDHRSLRLVVLNACETGRSAAGDPFSSMGGALLRAGVPAALTMQYAISDRAAVEFGRTFYEGLAHRVPVDATVTEARKAIRLALPGTLEWGTPVLHMRAVDGVLFEAGEVGDIAVAGRAAGVSAQSGGTGTEPVSPGPVRTDESVRADLGRYFRDRRAGGADSKALAFSRFFHGVTFAGADSERGLGAWSSPRKRTLIGPRQPRATSVGGVKYPSSLAFSDDSRLLAIGCHGRVAVVVDQAGERVCRVRPGGQVPEAAPSSFRYQDRVLAVAFDAADGALAAVAGASVHTWSCGTGASLTRRDLAAGGIFDVASVADGGRVVATGEYGRVRLTGPGDRTRTLQVAGHVETLALSVDGTLLAAVCEAKWGYKTARRHSEVLVWDGASGGELLRLPHDDSVRAVAFSRDGGRLATASGASVCIRDLRTGRRVIEIPQRAEVQDLAFGPDGLTIAVAHRWGATVWRRPKAVAMRDEMFSTVWGEQRAIDSWEHRSPPAGGESSDARSGTRAIAFSRDGSLLAVIEGTKVLLLHLT